MRVWSARDGFDMIRGVTIMPEYIQSEGVEEILDRVQAAGLNAVATSPYIMIPSERMDGDETQHGEFHREPPVDAGSGKVRLLERPLFGKRELWFTIAPSFRPNDELYEGLRYRPPVSEHVIDPFLNDFIARASGRGIDVYLQIQAAIPPSLRVQFGGPVEEDEAMLPDGASLKNPLSKNASLASGEVLNYTRALTEDLLQQYPGIHGVRFDWPEYPCYHLDAVFTDFNPQAAALSVHFEEARSVAARFYRKLHELTDQDLDAPNFCDLADESLDVWRTMKRDLVTRYNRSLCEVVRGHGKRAILHAFPPPFSDLTGFDFAANAEHADDVGMKLYTMHLPMILRNYGQQLLAWNPELSEERLVVALNRWLDLADEPLASLDAYAYPRPEQPHPVSDAAQARKIVAASAAGERVHIMTHTYGPVEDFARRLRVASAHCSGGFWINRYAYLDDKKYVELQTSCT